jgi:uncharacterized protein
MKFEDYFKLKEATIIVSNGCNLNCTYCFEHDKTNEKLSGDDMKTILDKCYESYSKIDDKNKIPLIINFFGGEPFLNFEVIEYALKYARDQKYNMEFGVTTNLTILTDHMIDVIEEYELGLLISIDGTKEIHDRNRCKSFDTVQKNIKRLMEKHLGYLLEARITLMPQDVTSLLDSIKTVVDMGIVNVAPVPVTDTIWNDQDIINLKDNLSIVWQWLFDMYNDNDNKKNISIKFIEDYMEKVLTMQSFEDQTKVCSAGSNQTCSIGVNGEIMPCHQRHTVNVGKDNLVMGNILEDTDIKPVAFNNMTRNSELDCSTCIAKNICRGGCPSENFTLNGNGNQMNKNQCRIYQAMCEVAINFQNDLLKCSNIRSHRLNVLAENLKLLEIFKNDVLGESKTSKEYLIKLHKFYETLMSKEGILLPMFEEAINVQVQKLINTFSSYKKEN